MAVSTATDIELVVLQWLDKRNINYLFQTSLMGGFYELGGATVDIILPDLMIAIRVQGEYWHLGVEARGRDQTQRELLLQLGYTAVVDLWESDIEDPT